MHHQSQSELLSALFGIFPEFEGEWRLDNEGAAPSLTLHSVYFSLTPFLAGINPTQRQFQKLATLINNAVAAGGDAENAVSTAFLEGLGGGHILIGLRPLLNRDTKARFHP